MIFYFSGTGNSKFVAEEIGRILKEKTYDISVIDVPDISKEKYVGFIFPIYAWGVCEPMLEFVKKLNATKAYTFAVATCGQDAGKALIELKQVISLHSCFSIVMPNNYIVGSELASTEDCFRILQEARKNIEKISERILNKEEVYEVQEGTFARIKTNLINKGFNQFARSTKPFYVTNDCNLCGTCMRDCPAHTIKIVDGKIIWNEKCYQCLKCINRCPQQAIQYGKKTKNKGRYYVEKYIKR